MSSTTSADPVRPPGPHAGPSNDGFDHHNDAWWYLLSIVLGVMGSGIVHLVARLKPAPLNVKRFWLVGVISSLASVVLLTAVPILFALVTLNAMGRAASPADPPASRAPASTQSSGATQAPAVPSPPVVPNAGDKSVSGDPIHTTAISDVPAFITLMEQQRADIARSGDTDLMLKSWGNVTNGLGYDTNLSWVKEKANIQFVRSSNTDYEAAGRYLRAKVTLLVNGQQDSYDAFYIWSAPNGNWVTASLIESP